MARRIRILFWPGWWYPSRLSPLSGVFIQRHAQAIARVCDVAVLFIAADPRSTASDACESSAVEGVQTVKMYYRPFPAIPGISRLLDGLKYYRLSRRGLKTIKKEFGTPDILHIHVNPPLGLLAGAFVHLRKIPWVFTEHWSGYFPESGAYKGFWRRRFNRWLIRRVKAVTVVSHASQMAMRAHGLENRYHLTPNVVDTRLFQPATVKKENTIRQVLHVSGLHPCKNVSGILRTVAKLARQRDDFALHIVGDSLHRRGLEALATELKIKDNRVFFHGAKSEAEVADLMRRADFLLLFSHYENFPCVIAEAFASGIPVVASRVGGIPEHVSGENGILADPNDEEALVAALDFMLDHYRAYDRRRIREYALAHFSPEKVAAMFFDVYKSLISDQDLAANGPNS